MKSTSPAVTSSMSLNLITVSIQDGLDVAYAKMIKHEIRHLPVIDLQGSVVGILSDRDLQRALKSKVSGTGPFRFESCEFDPRHKVGDYMSWPVKSVDHSTSLKNAVQKLITEKISAFIVTDQARVVGIITTEDMLKVLVDMLDSPAPGLKLTLQELITNPRIGQLAQRIADTGI